MDDGSEFKVRTMIERSFVTNRLIAQSVLSSIIRRLSKTTLKPGDRVDCIIYKRNGDVIIISDGLKAYDIVHSPYVNELYSKLVNAKDKKVYVPLSDRVYTVCNFLSLSKNGAKNALSVRLPTLDTGFFVSVGVGVERESDKMQADSDDSTLSGRTIVMFPNRISGKFSYLASLDLATLSSVRGGDNVTRIVGDIYLDRSKTGIQAVFTPPLEVTADKLLGDPYFLATSLGPAKKFEGHNRTFASDNPRFNGKSETPSSAMVIDEDPRSWFLYGKAPNMDVL